MRPWAFVRCSITPAVCCCLKRASRSPPFNTCPETCVPFTSLQHVFIAILPTLPRIVAKVQIHGELDVPLLFANPITTRHAPPLSSHTSPVHTS